MKTRSTALVIVLSAFFGAGAFGCGGDNGDDASGGNVDVVPCIGEECWECKPTTIKSGVRIVCETHTDRSDVPPTYDCATDVDHPCPPADQQTSDGIPDSDAGSSDLVTDAAGTDAGDAGSDAAPHSNDGVGDSGSPSSDHDSGSGGSVDAGSKDSSVGSDSGGTTGTDAGTGGGYHCTNTGGTIVCEGATTCDPGTHLSGGVCVPDTCGCSHDAGTSHDAGDAGTSHDASHDAGDAATSHNAGLGCSLTQGYWKNHASKWPVSSLVLGSKSYTKAALLTIFGTQPNGDASLILAHQLVAAKLNVASGASSSPIGGVIAQADAWLASNADTDGRLPFGVHANVAAGQVAVSLSAQLDAYNNGRSGVPHCN